MLPSILLLFQTLSNPKSCRRENCIIFVLFNVNYVFHKLHFHVHLRPSTRGEERKGSGDVEVYYFSLPLFIVPVFSGWCLYIYLSSFCFALPTTKYKWPPIFYKRKYPRHVHLLAKLATCRKFLRPRCARWKWKRLIIRAIMNHDQFHTRIANLVPWKVRCVEQMTNFHRDKSIKRQGRMNSN